MKKFCIVLMSLILIGCGHKEETSKILTEPIEVTEVVYSPSQHGFGMNAGIGISTSGNMVTTLGPTVVDVPEQYAVVLRCPHGKYIIKDRKLWEVLKVGDKGEAEYVEKYLIKRNSTKDIIEKRLVGYHTLNIIRNGERVLKYNR